MNLLRVPPEVELAGLDTIEYSPDIYLPENAARGEQIVEPDGTMVDAERLFAGEIPGSARR